MENGPLPEAASAKPAPMARAELLAESRRQLRELLESNFPDRDLRQMLEMRILTLSEKPVSLQLAKKTGIDIDRERHQVHVKQAHQRIKKLRSRYLFGWIKLMIAQSERHEVARERMSLAA